MQFDVAQLLTEPIGTTRWFQIQENAVPLQGVGDVWLQGGIQLTRTDSGIWAFSDIKVSRPTVCSRCLEDCIQVLTISLDQQYLEKLTVRMHSTPLPFDSDEDRLDLGADLTLDISEVVRQGIESSSPIKFLCQESCSGLCSNCGINLNESRCNCKMNHSDPRWAPLDRILSSMKTGS